MKYRYQYFFKKFFLIVVLELMFAGWIPFCWAESARPGNHSGHGSTPAVFTSEQNDKRQDRSPFNPSDLMKEYAVWGGYSSENGTDGYMKRIPKISARGFIEIAGKIPVALIDVDEEGVFVIRKGDEISLQKGINTLTLYVQKINTSEILIKIMPFDRILTIR